MTPEQQRRAVGISAEAEDGHVIIHADRSFQMMTLREIEVFHAHLHKAYEDAKAQLRRPLAVLA